MQKRDDALVAYKAAISRTKSEPRLRILRRFENVDMNSQEPGTHFASLYERIPWREVNGVHRRLDGRTDINCSPCPACGTIFRKELNALWLKRLHTIVLCESCKNIIALSVPRKVEDS